MTTILYTWIFAEKQSESLRHALFDSLPKKLLALEKRLSRDLADCGITEDDTSQSK